MDAEFDEHEAFFSRRVDKSIISKRFIGSGGGPMRIMSKIMEVNEALKEVKTKEGIVIRRTPSGRQEIKATVLEDDRRMTVLTFQKFEKGIPRDRPHFSFVGQEITRLLEFVAGIRTVPLPTAQKRHVTDEEMREIVLDNSQLRRALVDRPEILAEALKRQDLSRDIVALGYRRGQLTRFEQLLGDPAFFKAERIRLNKTGEGVWQAFFEANRWIFGYGLAYQFLGGLDERKLEQLVTGASILGVGKRADALMKTHGILNSLCFVEIKRHDTSLLEPTPYRPGVWSPSSELVSGVAQVQTTVQEAIERIGRKLVPVDGYGNPTGETIFNIEPRSFLVIGVLGEFKTEDGINEHRFRSFELFRRNTRRPDIVTFDELFQRAKFIVEQAE